MDKKQKQRYKELIIELEELADIIQKLKRNDADKLIFKDKMEQVFILQKEKDKIKRPDFLTRQAYKIQKSSYNKNCEYLEAKGLIDGFTKL